MGAWEVGNFGNDDAGDWLDDLEESAGADLLKKAFSVIEKGGYLESPECCIALAAAEIVATAKGKPPSDLPDQARDWLASQTAEDEIKALGKRAIAVVTRIQTNSEARELWEESESWQEWQRVLEGLLNRLGS